MNTPSEQPNAQPSLEGAATCSKCRQPFLFPQLINDVSDSLRFDLGLCVPCFSKVAQRFREGRSPAPSLAPGSAGTLTPLTDAVWKSVEGKTWQVSFEAMHDHAEKLEAQLTALAAERDVLMADKNISTHKADYLSRRLDNADDAIKLALPEYDKDNTPLSHAIGELHDRLNKANTWVAGYGKELTTLRQQLEALRKEGEEHEAETEQLWKDLCGLNPKTGVAWLTPRMNREAAAIQKRWDDEEAARAAQQAEGKRGEAV